jgi:4-amino-4-deoxy-L-arabinose transferase-like glycosyltransferase
MGARHHRRWRYPQNRDLAGPFEHTAALVFAAMSTHPGLAAAHRVSAGARGLLARRVARLTIALSVLFFVVVNCVGLADPGLEYDELLFVNGALGVPHAYHDFIYREAFGVPTMLMPYIGALKAWLYEPVFAIFGVSVDSIRVPAILLAGVAVLVAVAIARRLLGLWPALLLSILLVTDPAYGAMARTDWGPIVLSALLRMVPLLCYFVFLQRRSVRYLWLAVLALSLGLFNKLDYIWFIAAFGAAAVVVHHRELLDAVRRRPAAVLAPVAVLIAVGVAAFFTLILPADRLPTTAAQLSLGGRLTEVANLFRGTYDGSAVYLNMTGSAVAHTTLIGALIPYVLISSAGVALWLMGWGRRLPRENGLRQAATLTTFFLVLFVVLAVGIIFTRQATGPWHVMLLWPLPDLLALCLLVTGARVPSSKLRRALVPVVGIALAALLVTQARTTVDYVHAYRSDRNWTSPWSTEIYAATRTISQSAPRVQSVISADWGLGTEVYALGDESVRARFGDEWSSFTNPTATPASLQQEWFTGRRVIVVYHSQAAQMMPSTTQRVEAILKSRGSHVRPIFIGHQVEADEVTP